MSRPDAQLVQRRCQNTGPTSNASGRRALQSFTARQSCNHLENVALLEFAASQGAPLQRHGAILPAMGLQQVNRPVAPGWMGTPETASKRGIGPAKGWVAAGKIPDQRASYGKSADQDAVAVQAQSVPAASSNTARA